MVEAVLLVLAIGECLALFCSLTRYNLEVLLYDGGIVSTRCASRGFVIADTVLPLGH
jgi:hypothetical protein